jgi:tetratricopeptide (TPR) repeat protein
MNAFDYCNRGIAHYQAKEYDAAIAEFNTALSIDPDYTYAFEWRGHAYFDKGEKDKTLEDFTRMVELKPERTDGWSCRGNHYHEAGEYDKAIADYNRCIALMPEHPSYWLNRGTSYFEKGDYDKALADFDKSIAIDPENSSALEFRGRLYVRIGEYDKAIADFNREIVCGSKYDYGPYHRGRVYFEMGDWDRAIADFSAAIAINPDEADFWLGRGLAWYNKRGEEENDHAIDDFTQAIEKDPADIYAYFARGSALLMAAEEHVNTMRAVIMYKAKDEAERLLMMGQLANMGYKDFIPYANGLLKSLRSNRDELDTLMINASELVAGKCLGEALEDLDKVLSFEPDNAEAYYVRGRVYALAGDKDSALANYEKTCDLNPYHEKALEKRAELLENRGGSAG